MEGQEVYHQAVRRQHRLLDMMDSFFPDSQGVGGGTEEQVPDNGSELLPLTHRSELKDDNAISSYELNFLGMDYGGMQIEGCYEVNKEEGLTVDLDHLLPLHRLEGGRLRRRLASVQPLRVQVRLAQDQNGKHCSNGTQKTQISTCEDDAFDCHTTISKTRAISIYLTDSIFTHRPAYLARGRFFPKVFQGTGVRGRAKRPCHSRKRIVCPRKGEINAPQDKRCDSLIMPETFLSPISKTIGDEEDETESTIHSENELLHFCLTTEPVGK
ncbi:hypothetical protein CDAR_448991 [Caerostris darwini]|uniref:Uncharacterized protein n=1 Tax=Caerostris darwini TaxID=1538125 RepID=A0AAV4WAI5_9ARAC|nr:hypothetical protein CDAR_448991 [Caerostris darwini]